MQENALVLLVLTLVVVGLGVVAWTLLRARHRRSIARRYGREYERLARHEGGADRAIRELESREKRVGGFRLRELTPEQAEQHVARWNRLQAAFVDEPARAAQEAHLLLMEVMRDRGYPDADLTQRQRDLSVNYPQLIEPYREACVIAGRPGGASEATTEELRRATLCYRALLDALLNERAGPSGASRNSREVA